MSLAKVYAQVLGIVLLLVGILGFVAPLGGTTGLMPSTSELGIFPINNVHNVIHIATGLLGIYAGFAAGGAYARLYALVFGVVYTLVTIIGFVVAPGTDIHFLFQLVPLNLADNLLHLAIAATGLIAYFLTPAEAHARVAM
jgi:hypothetical protein